MVKINSYQLTFTIFFLLLIQNVISQDKSLPEVKDPHDTFNIKQSSFLLPQAHHKWKFSHAVSAYYILPPKDWILDIVNAPFFNYSCKLALPKAFNVQAGISTVGVSNRLNFGPFWNFSIKNFCGAIGHQAIFNLGVLNGFGFNSKLTGWEQQPSLTLAYNFGKTAVIIRGDLFFTTSFNLSEAGFVITSKDRFLNGYSGTINFDQRLFKNKVMSVGFKLSYVRYHIIAWPALPVNRYRYPVPEFQLGYNF